MLWKTRKKRRYRFDPILEFLPVFESPDFLFAEYQAVPGRIPIRRLTTDAIAFVRALEDNKWIVAFDWMEWQDEAAGYVENPALLAQADAPTLAKLLTTHVGIDRFHDGHLADMHDNGHLVAILRRMRQLRDEAGT